MMHKPGFMKGVRVQVTEGPLRGVQGVIDSTEGSMIRVSVVDLPPRMERSELGAFVVVRAIHCRVL